MKTTKTINNKSNVVRGEFQRGLFARVVDQIKVWNQHRVAIRQLNLLSDRMLSDIGIDRFDISAAVRSPGSFERPVAFKSNRPEVSAEVRRAA